MESNRRFSWTRIMQLQLYVNWEFGFFVFPQFLCLRLRRSFCQSLFVFWYFCSFSTFKVRQDAINWQVNCLTSLTGTLIANRVQLGGKGRQADWGKVKNENWQLICTSMKWQIREKEQSNKIQYAKRTKERIPLFIRNMDELLNVNHSCNLSATFGPAETLCFTLFSRFILVYSIRVRHYYHFCLTCRKWRLHPSPKDWFQNSYTPLLWTLGIQLVVHLVCLKTPLLWHLCSIILQTGRVGAGNAKPLMVVIVSSCLGCLG